VKIGRGNRGGYESTPDWQERTFVKFRDAMIECDYHPLYYDWPEHLPLNKFTKRRPYISFLIRACEEILA
jgi:hypothetical protein